MAYCETKGTGNKSQKNAVYKDGLSDRPVITVDYEKYAQFLEDSGLSEEQKRKFLQTLWNIIVGFIDLGFGVHPAQQAQSPCGQLAENIPISAISQADKVKWPDRLLIENFEEAAGRQSETVGEESS